MIGRKMRMKVEIGKKMKCARKGWTRDFRRRMKSGSSSRLGWVVQLYAVSSGQVLSLLFYLVSVEVELMNQSHGIYLSLKVWLCLVAGPLMSLRHPLIGLPLQHLFYVTALLWQLTLRAVCVSWTLTFCVWRAHGAGLSETFFSDSPHLR